MKLGIIGLSEGNGHPYSWAAICNGYESSEMKKCEFAAIPEYLAKENFPQAQIANVQVTHIWTQDVSLSRKVANASRITHVCEDLADMIGEVDGVLLARDDSENHLAHATMFLEAGLPIYIDKPLALTRKGADELFALQKWESQIFSCSALYFADELAFTKNDSELTCSLQAVIARTPKSWAKYAVHIVEPIIRTLGHDFQITDSKVLKNNELTSVGIKTDGGPLIHLLATGKANSAISVEYIGENGSCKKLFSDAFSSFKAALEAYLEQAQTRNFQIPRAHTHKVIEVLELGECHE